MPRYESNGISDHSLLDNLDYTVSGHTGFQPAGTYLDTETDPVFSDWLDTPPNISIFTNDSNYVDISVINDTAYGAGWDDDTTHAPTKNAVYDAISGLGGGHDAVTLDATITDLLTLTGQDISLDTQTANYVFAGPESGTAAVPAFRALVAGDIPDLSGTYLTSFTEEDPVFMAWDKSTGISITESQISDFGSYEPANANIQTHIEDTSIHTEDNLLVHLAGSETITGLKTFDTLLPQSDLVPSDPDDLVNKFYADSIALGFKFKDSTKIATIDPLPTCTYDNGTAGVGATLTKVGNGSLGAIDGYTLLLNERILVKNQVDAFQNGIYEKTQVGDGSNPWILTRATDYDDASKILEGTACLVLNGTIHQATQWAMTSIDPLDIGTDAINFLQIAAQKIFSASNGIKVVVNDAQIDLSDTSPSLEISDGGLRAKVDDSSIERASGGLQVKALGITNAMLAGSIANGKLDTITAANKVDWDAVNKTGSTLDSIGDINAPSPTDNQALTWDTATSKWVPETITSGGSGSVDSVVAGDNVTVDDTDPANPIVASNFTTYTPYAEVPTGLVNSSNTDYTLAHTPSAESSVIVILDGVTQYNGTDYTLDGTTITFTTAPVTGSTIFAYYTSVNGGASAIFSGLSKITVGVTEPTSPNNGDIWIQIIT